MITDKLTIYAQIEDVNNVCELVSGCIPKTEINMVPLAAFAPNEKFCTLPSDVRCVVLQYGAWAELDENLRKLTYSIEDTKGDIAALNIQKRETCTCFEVLYGVFMSRVFVSLGSKYTVTQVVLAICILCGWGASIDKIIPLINELLK